MKTINNKKIVTFLLSLIFCSTINAQTTIIFQPNGSQGKDAFIESRLNNNNYGNHIDFPAMSWTNRGTPVDARGLIDFDLSNIPNGATINSASLSLYSYNSPANGANSTQDGSNRSVLTRITNSWDESTVTWNNQPKTTTQNQVFLPASTNSIQDYLNIDVTNLVQDMIINSNSSYGFLLKLVTEQYYRKMIFASSDNADSTMHPKLEVTFTEATQYNSCITLRPDGAQGKDAFIESRLNNNNYGNHIDFPAMSWTNRGTPVDARGLIDFDLSNIPNGATIDSASLSLYSYSSPANGANSTQDGSNRSVLTRITNYWDESTVTWNNQPTTTTQNQVFLPASTNSIQDYLNIDVTNLVQDMIMNPNSSYGFLLKLVTEQYYRKMIFASSDNADSTLHPKLDICYNITTSTTENITNSIEFKLFPNPASNFITIDLSSSSHKLVSIDIINSSGQIIKRKADFKSNMSIDISDYTRGMYFVKAYFDDFVSTKKLIIK